MIKSPEEIKKGKNLIVSLQSIARQNTPKERESNFSPLSKIVLIHRDKIPPILKKVIGRKLDRFMYHKLRRLIYTLSFNINLPLIKQISRRLYDMIQFRTHKILVRFRLVGTVWPPVIVYRTKITNIHTLQLPGNEINAKCTQWRFLFTDQIFFSIEKLPSIVPSPARFHHPVLPFCKGGIRGRQKYIHRIEDIVTMQGLLVKTNKRKKRRVVVSQIDLSFKHPAKEVDPYYKHLWLNLGIVLLQWNNLSFN